MTPARIAGAVGADEAEDLARLNFKVDRAHGFELAVVLGQVAHFDCGRGCGVVG
jgi:hypothetical protein